MRTMYNLRMIVVATALVQLILSLLLLPILHKASVQIMLFSMVLLYYILGLMILAIFWVIREMGTTGSGQIH